jgi:hypothetical protein
LARLALAIVADQESGPDVTSELPAPVVMDDPAVNPVTTCALQCGHRAQPLFIDSSSFADGHLTTRRCQDPFRSQLQCPQAAWTRWSAVRDGGCHGSGTQDAQAGNEKDRGRQKRAACSTGTMGEPGPPQANYRFAWCADRGGSAWDFASLSSGLGLAKLR